MFEFIFGKKEKVINKKVFLEVLKRELELLSDIDKLSEEKIKERREKIRAYKYTISQDQKNPLVENGNSKNNKIKDYKNGKYYLVSCSA